MSHYHDGHDSYSNSNHNSDQVTETIYTCLMHPQVRKTSEGLCPECGMKLIKGRDKHLIHSITRDGNDGGTFLEL